MNETGNITWIGIAQESGSFPFWATLLIGPVITIFILVIIYLLQDYFCPLHGPDLDSKEQKKETK